VDLDNSSLGSPATPNQLVSYLHVRLRAKERKAEIDDLHDEVKKAEHEPGCLENWDVASSPLMA
jgi:hypothetical protein